MGLRGLIGNRGAYDCGMDSAGNPSSVLAAAGRRHLGVMGLTQKGRSRLWFDDHGAWLINAEFQPSGFSEGSYLNVGVQWLWRPVEMRTFAFDKLATGKPWVSFSSVDEFIPKADDLALAAAGYVRDFRKQFPSLEAIADFFLSLPRPTPTDRYFGAVALGVIGRRFDAAAWFDAFLSDQDDREWAIRWHEQAKYFAA